MFLVGGAGEWIGTDTFSKFIWSSVVVEIAGKIVYNSEGRIKFILVFFSEDIGRAPS